MHPRSRLARPSFIALIILCFSQGAASAPAASSLFDPSSGDYIITYEGEDGGTYTIAYEPGNKTAPFVRSSIRLQEGGLAYHYRITNGSQAKQDLLVFDLRPISGFTDSSPIRSCRDGAANGEILKRSHAASQTLSKPAEWGRSAGNMDPLLCRQNPDGDISYVAGWAHVHGTSPGALPPGQFQEGFSFPSYDLPGIGRAGFDGLPSRRNEFPENGKGNDALNEVFNELARVEREIALERYAAVPTFEIPNPFSPAPLLEKIRDHAKTWPTQQLMEQGLWASVDGHLASAVTAFRKGHTAGGLSALAQARVELRKKYPDLDLTTTHDDPKPSDIPSDPAVFAQFLSVHDQRLAAKVLDFDVDYVINRLDPKATDVACAGAQTCSPAVDLDGEFTVSWPATQHPCTAASHKCTSEVKRYVLEMANSSSFTGGKVLYEGLDRSFRVSGLAPGQYHFRVTAHVEYCDKPINWANYCADNPDYKDQGSTTYQGSQTTVRKP